MIPLYEPLMGKREEELVLECVKSGWISSRSPLVARFERSFLDLIGANNGFAVSSGSGALHLALLGLDIGPGDEVIIPSFSFSATAAMTILTGARPVFCDVDPKTWVAGPAEIKRAMTRDTKAIIAVHTYGVMAPIAEISALTAKRGIALIEDAAEALGSRQGEPIEALPEFTPLDTRPVDSVGKSASAIAQPMAGTFGDAGVFSFYGNKTITTGEGGFVVFKDAEISDRALGMRGHGSAAGPGNYESRMPGFSHRMTGMQAAVGIAQIERFGEIAAAKRRISERYFRKLSGIAGLRIQNSTPGYDTLRWLITARIADPSATKANRDCIISYLLSRGIQAYPAFTPLHTLTPLWKCAAGIGGKHPDIQALPVSMAIGATGFCLPSGPGLTDEQIDLVCGVLEEFFTKFIESGVAFKQN